MALFGERNTPTRGNGDWAYPIAANVKIFAGGLVAIEGGYLTKGREATGLLAAGRAEESVDNTGGGAGAAMVRVRRGIFLYRNKGDDAVTQADVGKDCFIVDDETVARTDAGGARSKCGTVRGIEPGGVWVEI